MSALLLPNPCQLRWDSVSAAKAAVHWLALALRLVWALDNRPPAPPLAPTSPLAQVAVPWEVPSVKAFLDSISKVLVTWVERLQVCI